MQQRSVFFKSINDEKQRPPKTEPNKPVSKHEILQQEMKLISKALTDFYNYFTEAILKKEVIAKIVSTLRACTVLREQAQARLNAVKEIFQSYCLDKVDYLETTQLLQKEKTIFEAFCSSIQQQTMTGPVLRASAKQATISGAKHKA